MPGLVVDDLGPVNRLTLDRPARLDTAAGQGDGLSLDSFASAMLAFTEDNREGTPAWRGQ
jgi:hypothetical protein